MVNTGWSIHGGKYKVVNTGWSILGGKYRVVNTGWGKRLYQLAVNFRDL